MNFQDELTKRRLLVEEALQELMPAEETFPYVIHQAMRYAVLNGGKRLRPILVLEGATVAGGDYHQALPVACALEMIHSYSLVHDDLPAMDDDDLRRGKPTCHKVFGEAVAILAGDGLLTMAFQMMAGMARKSGVVSAHISRVIEEVALAVGSQGMIGGQIVDLESQGSIIDEKTLLYMHNQKTGALFRASLKAGARLFGLDGEPLCALNRYATNLGLAFQITDDILDVEGDEGETGKAKGSDARKGKSTFVTLYGIEQSRLLAQDSVFLAIKSLDGFGEEADFLRELARFILGRRS